MFLDGLYFSTLITSLYAVHVGLRLSDVVFAQAVYSTAVFLMEVPTGIIADKFGKKFSMISSFVAGNIGIVIFLLSPGFHTLLLMRIFQATGNALNSGAWEALLYDIAKPLKLNFQKVMGSVLSLSTFGQAITGIVIAFALMRWGSSAYVPLFVLTLATQALGGVTTAFIREEKAVVEVQETKRVLNIAKDSFRLFRHNSVLFALAAVGFLTVANEYFMYQTYGPYITDMGVNALWVGLIFTLGLCLNALLQRNIYRIEQYLTLEKILGIVNFTIAGAYILLALSPNALTLILAAIIVIGFANVERPVVSDYANNEINSNIRSTVLSGFSLTSRISKLMLTFLVGAVMVGNSAAIGYLIHAGYITIGMIIGWWLLVKCGCVHKVRHV